MMDKNLMRAKDILLVVGAVAGLMAGFLKIYEKPFQVERDYKAVREKLNGHTSKYESLIDLQESRITTNQLQIIKTLERIEKKVDNIH